MRAEFKLALAAYRSNSSARFTLVLSMDGKKLVKENPLYEIRTPGEVTGTPIDLVYMIRHSGSIEILIKKR